MAGKPTTCDEQTPLLSPDGVQSNVGRTPLPRKQISIILLLSFCGTAAVYSSYPFLNKLLLSLTGGDETKVLYYAGIMEASRSASFLITIVYWGRVSDRVGRKPILLLSCAAVVTSILLLGLSKTFWMVIVSRCISGGFNSNVAITKTVIGEVTDDTNRADGFALLNVPWSLGVSIGHIIGGLLSNPHINFPEMFSGRIWWDFPYLLPCAAIALVSSLAFLVTLVYFRETLPHKPNSSTPVEETSTATRSQLTLPFRALLTSRVLLSVSNYVVISFLTKTYLSIQPLFFAMSIPIGGLGLEPLQIGAILGSFGLCNAFVQTLFLGPSIRRFGLRVVLRYSLLVLIPIYLLFPLMNIYAKGWQAHQDSNSRVMMYTLLTIQLFLFAIHDLGHGCSSIYIASSVPNKRSLGSVNGVAQMSASVARLVGPVFVNTLLALSIVRGWMGGYAAYFVLSFMAGGGVYLVGMLPESAWKTEDSRES